MLAFALTTSVLASPAGAASGFGDVEDGRWYTEPIAWMVSESITTGTEPGCFSPNDPVTRGQIVTFLYRLDSARGNNPTSDGHPFDDVVADYQQQPVGWAYKDGVTRGTGPTSFSPEAHVTRGQFAALLWRYAGSPTPSTTHPFHDVVRAYQAPAISWMAEAKITTGTSPTTFNPSGSMTRAEAATFLFRYMAPGNVAQIAASTSCLAELRGLLEQVGLTPSEAACAAPHLSTFEDTYLLSVFEDVDKASTELLSAVVRIVNDGCIPFTRLNTLISLIN